MPDKQQQFDWTGRTTEMRSLLTRLDKALQRSGISFGDGDPKNKLSARTLYNVLQAIHGWSVKTGRTDKPAGKLAPSISLRVARRAIAVLRSEVACCVLAIEDERRDGAPVQWKRICWPNLIEWIEKLAEIVPPAKKPRTRVPVNQELGAGETETRVPDRHGDGCRSGTDMGAGAAPCLYSNEIRRSLRQAGSEPASESLADSEIRKAEHADSCLLGELHEPEGTCEESRANGADRTNRERQGDPGTVLPGHQLASEHNNQDGLPMPTRTVDPREQSIIARLIALDVGSARATLREALRIGYTIEAIEAIIGWYEGLILVDPDTQERVVPYWPGALVKRLRDEDARRAEPSQGHWSGRRAEWTALKARLDDKPAVSRVPDLAHSRRLNLVQSLTRQQILDVLQVLSTQQGDLAARAGRCHAWVRDSWPADHVPLIPPQSVTGFLMQVDVESIMRGIR